MISMITIAPITSCTTLPSYRLSHLSDEDTVVCKMLDNYRGTDFDSHLIFLKEGQYYELKFKLVKVLSKNALCCISEQVEMMRDISQEENLK